jgi:ankyrin repeat protein
MYTLSEFKDAVKKCDFEIVEQYTKYDEDEYIKEYEQSILWKVNRYRYSIDDRFVFHTLAKKGLSMNTVNRNGQTLLHVAAEENNEQFFEDILKYDVDIEIVDNTELTPLFYAVMNRNIKMIKRLIYLDVNVDVTDSYGWTPLMYLIINISQHHLVKELDNQIITLLLLHSQMTDEMKTNILDLCNEFNRRDISKLIRKMYKS